ncbi:MAG: molybdenum cofactor guanylyltransferase [Thermodesulfovibrionales bacterium]|nr:molybdenum cofactor guanylyltransferase [Thermodesulfovibrionales bacterium]
MKSLSNYGNRVSGAILAGGKNRRFPSRKGFLRVDGHTLIERNIEVLNTICSDVLINTNDPELYFRFKVRMCGDIFPFKGPMGGIHSCLLNAKYDNLLIVACDMPFLKVEVLSFLIERHLQFERNDLPLATIPIYNNKFQSLCGIYSKRLISLLEDHLIKNKNSLSLFLRDVEANFIGEKEIRVLDPEGLTFLNVNTFEDFIFLKLKFPNLAFTS